MSRFRGLIIPKMVRVMKPTTKFRPCIDLHEGKVKQIVGGTLSAKANADSAVVENFVSEKSPVHYAEIFHRDGLEGGHVIKLGPGNDNAALAILNTYPGAFQLGGGVDALNASNWLEAGASKVIVTSWLFDESGRIQPQRLEQLTSEVGAQRVVIDLSCRRTQSGGWSVATHQWQEISRFEITHSNLDWLVNYASEFLLHAVDVEGLCNGFDAELVHYLGQWGKIPITYAGGISTMADLDAIETLSQGKLDVTVGSALDLYGGKGIRYQDLIDWNRKRRGGKVTADND
jgi:phosphoribosylformimino-5-aminoimidazole carboxamide ribotide isomerase